MTEFEPSSKEILIVDDQPENLTVLRKMLSEEGFTVRPAINGPLALKAARETPPDLVLLDIMMPDMDGFEVCRRLKEDEDLRDIPVIFVSALSDTVDKLRGFALGAVDYVAKPFKSEEVLARVNVHLDLKRFRESYKALQRENETLLVMRQAVYQSVSETIVTVDRGLNIVNTNKTPENICMNGGDFQARLTTGEGHCGQVLLKTIKTRQPVGDYEVSCDCQGSAPRRLILNCTPLIDSQNLFSGAVLVVRDITRLAELERNLADRHHFGRLVGKSEAMRKLYLLLEQVADTDLGILITGENGTGKELVAEAIHYQSRRADRPLIKIDCSVFSEKLLESELFGHVRGALGGADEDRAGRLEAADGGTLLLEEIGDAPIDTQDKLLRFLEQGEFERLGDGQTRRANVRVLASSSSDIKEKIARDSFREDLYRRLQGIAIHLPPLKERSEDIPLLAGHFLRSTVLSQEKRVEGFSEEALSILVHYTWPGNVKELKQAVEQAVAVCPGGLILPGHLPRELRDFANARNTIDNESFIYAPKFDREILEETMKRHNWSKAPAAGELNVGINTLDRYLEKYNVKPPRNQSS